MAWVPVKNFDEEVKVGDLVKSHDYNYNESKNLSVLKKWENNMTDKDKSAFPLMTNVSSYSSGITAKEYAAIHLKVPESGTLWLDEMIDKSNEAEFNRYAELARRNRLIDLEIWKAEKEKHDTTPDTIQNPLNTRTSEHVSSDD